MVSVIGLDSDKVQQLCDAANQEVPEAEKVQIANYLCPVSFLRICLVNIVNSLSQNYGSKLYDEYLTYVNCLSFWKGNYAVSGGIKGVEAVEAKAKSFKARMTV